MHFGCLVNLRLKCNCYYYTHHMPPRCWSNYSIAFGLFVQNFREQLCILNRETFPHSSHSVGCVRVIWARPGVLDKDRGCRVWEEKWFQGQPAPYPILHSLTHAVRMGRLHSSEKHLPVCWMEGNGALNRAAWCGGWGRVNQVKTTPHR